MSDSKRPDDSLSPEDTAPASAAPDAPGDAPLGFDAKPSDGGASLDRRRLLTLSLSTAAAAYAAPKILGSTAAGGQQADSAQQGVVAEKVPVELPYDNVLNFVDQRGILKSDDGESEYSFHGSGHLHISVDGAVEVSRLSLRGGHISGPNKGEIVVEQEAVGFGSYGAANSKTALIASVPVKYSDATGSDGGVNHLEGFVAAGRASLNGELDIYGGTNGRDVYVGVSWSKSC